MNYNNSNDTFIIEDGINCCYVCGFAEDVIECPDCKEFFFFSETKELQLGENLSERYCDSCCHLRMHDDEMDYYYWMERQNDS